MKIACQSLILAIGSLSYAAAAALPPPQLLANHPAASWDHAYPVGNGSLDAMSLGIYPKNRVILPLGGGSQPGQARFAPGARRTDRAGDGASHYPDLEQAAADRSAVTG
jgi:hypothetical protein